MAARWDEPTVEPGSQAAQTLANVVLFAGLPWPELEDLARYLRRRRFARGEVIFMRGDPGTSLYVVERGRVKISLTSPEGREIVLAVLGPGDFFGDLALLDGQPRSADATAVEPSVLLLLERGDFLRCLRQRPQVTERLLTVLGQRLRQDTELVQEAAFLDVPARLARALLRLCEGTASAEEDGSVRVTQAEIAGMIGATRESVSKWLGAYERMGLVRVGRGRVTVLDPQRLRQRLRNGPPGARGLG